VLPSTSLSPNPLADIRGTISQDDSVRFAALQKVHGISTGESYVFEVKDYGLCVRLRPNVCFQLRDMFFIYLAAQRKYHLPVRRSLNLEHQHSLKRTLQPLISGNLARYRFELLCDLWRKLKTFDSLRRRSRSIE
jgi:hypothetical protein